MSLTDTAGFTASDIGVFEFCSVSGVVALFCGGHSSSLIGVAVPFEFASKALGLDGTETVANPRAGFATGFFFRFPAVMTRDGDGRCQHRSSTGCIKGCGVEVEMAGCSL